MDEIGYCGWDCGKCANYKKNANCLGCRKDQEMISDCFTRDCCKKRSITYCCQCKEFPCETMVTFYHRNEKSGQAYVRMCQMLESGK